MNYFRYLDDRTYGQWIAAFDNLTNKQAAALEHAMRIRPGAPRIAVVPLGTPGDAKDVLHFATSLKDQISTNWHICLRDTASGFDGIPHAAITGKNFGARLRSAAATADFILPLPFDARLPRHALAQFTLVLKKAPNAAIVYGDEDRLLKGKRTHPHFKTNFDSFLMLGRDLIGIPALYRASAILGIDPDAYLSVTLDNFLHELGLRISAGTGPERIVHIPAILCHRTKPPAWNADESRAAARAHLADRGLKDADVGPAPLAPQWNRIIFPLPAEPPLVSLIIPTRDRADLIGPCLEGLLKRTDYPSIEVLIVDNATAAADALSVFENAKQDPRVRLIRDNRDFNYSQLNNLAVAQTRGSVIVLLNNDTNIIHPDWLRELVSLVLRPEVGIVGAKLLNAESGIQHAGLVYGPDSAFTHQLCLLGASEAGPEGELALLRQVSAVTGACLAIRRDLYLELGGLNENAFHVAYNDIDLCMRVAQRGLAIVWTPHARLFHFGSRSRGPTNRPGPADYEFSENMRFWMTHVDRYEDADPFHNPQITFFYEHVDLARPPRPHPLRLSNLLGKQAPVPAFY